MASRKKTYGTGTISNAGPNKWRIRIFMGHDASGKEIRPSKTITGTKTEALREETEEEMRHTQATLLIGANTDIKTVQTRLGHSSINMTLDTYSHAIEANDCAASDIFSSILERNRGEESDTTPSTQS